MLLTNHIEHIFGSQAGTIVVLSTIENFAKMDVDGGTAERDPYRKLACT